MPSFTPFHLCFMSLITLFCYMHLKIQTFGHWSTCYPIKSSIPTLIVAQLLRKQGKLQIMALDMNMIKREFLCGGTAGAIGIFIGFPFDLVKTQIQSFPGRFPSAWSCFVHTVKQGGVSALFTGCIPPVMMQGTVCLIL